MSSPYPNKRQVSRIHPFVAPCRLEAEGRGIVGYLADLSPCGTRVCTDDLPPPVGTRVGLEVRLGRGAWLHLQAEVKWSHEVPGGRFRHALGLTFHDLDVPGREAIDATVKEIERRASLLQ
jgi:hypothetical protein